MPHYDTNPIDFPALLQRRELLGQMGTGLGGIALACLLANEAGASGLAVESRRNPLAPHAPHFAPRAKRVIQIFCPGAVSQIDTFEYKPELIKRHGQPMPGQENLVTFQGGNGALMRSPWDWKQYG